jgi:alpha-L-rhamnosidase
VSSSPFSNAFWIGSPLCGGAQIGVPAPFLRKTFHLQGRVKSARLNITALGFYDCEINGKRINDHVFSPGWTDYRKRVQYQVCDVTTLLNPDENVLGAVLGDGWFCGRIAWMHRQNYGDRPWFLAKLEITYEDGTTIDVSTDKSWRTRTGPILENDLISGEAYDARLDLSRWSEPGYDEEGWHPIQVLVSPPEIEFTLSTGPPVRRMEELDSKSSVDLPSWPQNVRIFDLGQNFSGRIRLKVKAPRGTSLQFRFAEVLNSDGKLYLDNLRTARATDFYTCSGGSLEIWEPRFTFHGFRYVEVTGFEKTTKLEITGIVLYSNLPTTGHFACSNPLLNRLFDNIVWSQKSNFTDIPTDCCQRDERLGWTGDAQVFVRTAAFNMDVESFFKKWLQDIRDSQKADGAIPPFVPDAYFDPESERPRWLSDGGPGWSDAAIICPWTIYLCYGDESILKKHYSSMELYMRFVVNHASRDYIRSHPDLDAWQGFGDWLALDGSDGREGLTARDLIGTAFYAYIADIMAETAKVLRLSAEEKHYRLLRRNIEEAFQNRFVTRDGLVTSGTQTAYVLALAFNLLPAESRSIAMGELVRDIKKREFHLTTGFIGTPWLLGVLEQQGQLELAYKLLEQETFPSWLFPVKNGATTIWERWDGWTREKGFQDKTMNSFNHYAYGAVGAWMVQAVAGLDLDSENPGYRHVLFRPRPGGSITFAEASLITRRGLVSIKWRIKDDRLLLWLQVPPDTRATLSLPDSFSSARTEFEPGTYHLEAKNKMSEDELPAIPVSS